MPNPSKLPMLLARVHPADRVVGALLTIAVVVAAVRLPAVGNALVEPLLFHAGLLGGYLVAIWMLVRRERSSWVQLARPALTVVVIFTLYSSLGRLGVEAMPYLADESLSHFDTWLFGVNPTLAIERLLTHDRVEFFSFVYGAFIPYIHVTIVLNCLGRPPLERDQFLTGWVFTYALSYLGYIFVPGRGPGFLHAAEYQFVLDGGFFYDLVVRGVQQTGGLQGVFPSLHVGGSLYLCVFELRTNRLRGLIFLPLVILIYVATLVLRYHYVIDLIVGTMVALTCLPLGWAVFLGWARRRQALGLPALPGGEGDAVLAVPAAGTAGVAAVFPAD